METRVSLLSDIGYVPSYKPKNPKPVPKLLEDEESWTKLVADVNEYISSSKAKKKGAGVVKAFTVTIFDTSQGTSGDKVGGKSAKKKQDEGKPALLMTTEEQKERDALRNIEAEHHCQEHKKPCYVLKDGEHYHYTYPDLAKWARLLAKGHATVKTPPEELNLADGHVTQRQVKGKANAAKANPEAPGSPWAAQAQATQQMMAAAAPFMFGLPPMMNAWAMMQMQNGQAAMSPQKASSSSGDTATLAVPTSGQKRTFEIAATVDYPDVKTWLVSIDSDPVHGRQGLNFAQYGSSLEDNGILDLTDLIYLSSEKLQELTGMKFGIANRLLRYADEDNNGLVSKAKLPRID
ncbi:hypothetical protein BV22DRAFT_1129956 [Leucogyrophana mollusca]|uniref:Uncharacterized protein n=1 Tax=Leucogyrophana mollusca TaxID=85980 RepID=A0ACB8BHN8_9AGAM|nr:hypothetical protein BV22DRAFT_1129956 [Leucogyrophana mollusca]